MSEPSIYLPGDSIPPEQFGGTEKKSKTLTLGPGLQYEPPSTIGATIPGSLNVDTNKNAFWLETNGRGRYVPSTGDLVIATVHHSSVDSYHVAISPYTSLATLSQLAFEGATKKTRPMLQPGSVVYARVSMANKHMEPELECVHPSTGRAEGLGELKGGMLFDISLGMARRMLMNKTRQDGGIAVLEELGEKGLRFEVAVGRNGRFWVNAENVRAAIAVGRAVTDTDQKALTIEQQTKLARSLIKSVS